MAKLGRPQSSNNTNTADDTFYKISECIKGIPEQTILLQFFVNNLNPIIEKIRKIAEDISDVWEKDDKEAKYVAHYTSLKTADIIVMRQEDKYGQAKLRYSNAVFMNDPDEGRILIDYLGYIDKTAQITTAFYDALKEEKNNFYLGSFLPVTEGHQDELLMWRTYGKDELQNEAAGCCLLIDINFFDKGDNKGIALSHNKDISEITPQPLYKVLYYNQRKHEFEGDKKIGEEMISMKYELLELLKMKKAGSTDEIKRHNKAIDKVLYHTLSELRYFFKSSDYAYESELRVIQFATHKETVKTDVDSGVLPRKLYIESSKGVKNFIKKMVLGPKVIHPSRWIYLEKQMEDEGHSLEIVASECHFQ